MAKKEEKLPCEVCPVYVSIAAAGRLKEELKEILPKDFREHSRAARKEQLLAVRSLIDAAIDHLEQKPERNVLPLNHRNATIFQGHLPAILLINLFRCKCRYCFRHATWLEFVQMQKLQ